MNAPCKDCKKRKLKCHAYCEDYREFRKERDGILLKRKKEAEKISEQIECSQKLSKRLGMQK